jgi:hypothetical protein
LGYEILDKFDEYPHLISVGKISQGETFMLKFIKSSDPEIVEVAFLKHLSSVDSPRNHTLRPIRSWDIDGGTIISMPLGGINLKFFYGTHAQYLSVAVQLIEGLAFLHENGIAHLDIKPQNLLVHPDPHRLSIIDFRLSAFTKGKHLTINGFRGTRGHTAPEVRKEQYDPIRADL